jgi:hypothetical protein
MRKARRSSLSAMSRITGAEKPRSSEGTGSAARPVKVQLREASLSSSTRVVSPGPASPASTSGRSAPSGPIRPTATGMCSGSLSGWPAVGGVCCESVRV